MLYMLMINYDPTTTDAEPRNRQPDHAALEQEMRNDGRYAGGAGLFPLEHATVVRHAKGGTVVTDGPFAETKEAIGGFFVVECAEKDEAIDYAKRISVGSNAWVQVRPVALWHAL